MGIYYRTIICFGFKTDKSNIDVIKTKYTCFTEKNFIIDNKYVFVIMPQSLYQIGSMDRCIEKTEIELGYVTINEIIRATKLDEKFFEIDPELLDTFKRISTDNIQSNNFGWNIIEYMYATYDGISVPILTHCLPIMIK